MRFSATLALAMVPVALAKAVHNVYPVRRDDHKSSKDHNHDLTQFSSSVGITQIIILWINAGGGAETEDVHPAVTVTKTVTEEAAATHPPAALVTHNVVVGGAAGLVYTPPEVKAAVGDVVLFTFESANHTATQSSFTDPCNPMAGGMDSGFQPNPNNTVSPAPQVAMQVMVDTPLWFYCRQSGHCGKGMVFSINPTADKTQAMFQSMAIAQKGTGAGSAITGNGTAAAAPAASAPATGVATGDATKGTGTVDSSTGVCICAVSCAVGSFPAVLAQGINSFGGLPGALAASMLEA